MQKSKKIYIFWFIFSFFVVILGWYFSIFLIPGILFLLVLLLLIRVGFCLCKKKSVVLPLFVLLILSISQPTMLEYSFQSESRMVSENGFFYVYHELINIENGYFPNEYIITLYERIGSSFFMKQVTYPFFMNEYPNGDAMDMRDFKKRYGLMR